MVHLVADPLWILLGKDENRRQGLTYGLFEAHLDFLLLYHAFLGKISSSWYQYIHKTSRLFLEKLLYNQIICLITYFVLIPPSLGKVQSLFQINELILFPRYFQVFINGGLQNLVFAQCLLLSQPCHMALQFIKNLYILNMQFHYIIYFDQNIE